MTSYWEKEHWYDKYDFAIIGAGIVGLSSAIELRHKFPKSSILIIERGKIPHGASTKNAGFACFGTLTEILDDLNSISEKECIELIKLRWNGLKRLQDRVPAKLMNLFNHGGSELFKNVNEYEKYSDKLIYVNNIIEEAIQIKNVLRFENQSFFSGLYKKSVKNDYESQLNPVKLIKYLMHLCYKLDISIQFNTDVKSYEDAGALGLEIIFANEQVIKCSKLIICNNAFAKRLIPALDIIPARNQVLISKPIENLNIKGTYHFDKGYIYFRDIEDRILIGGARNIDLQEETTDQFGNNQKIVDYLIQFVNEKLRIQKFELDYKWSGIIASGSKKSSIIEQKSDNVYLAVRQGGMGIAIGSEVAYKVTELIE